MSAPTNYCTEFAQTYDKLNTGVYLTEVIELAKNAVKFRLPHNGVSIDPIGVLDMADKVDDLSQSQKKALKSSMKDTFSDFLPIVKLPYEKVALEFSTNGTNMPSKIIVLLQQPENQDPITISIVSKDPKMGAVMSKWNVLQVRAIMQDYQFRLEGYTQSRTIDLNFNDFEADYCRSLFSYIAYCIFSFLAALNCSNVKVEDIPAPKMLNKKRLAKGMIPYSDYKTLVIESHKTANQTQTKTGNGSHASPREHLRRGHIRRLGDRQVWVNSCVVNPNTQSKIEKQYLVR